MSDSRQTAQTPLYYTFGNHMHWVDMEWLWGYEVLPSSVRDMLEFCRATGTKGNINFDAVGYERLAAQAPEALAELREAIEAGTIEVVGASYAQPYGLFHGGESNIRQRLYGARAVRRLLGVWPTTFWEEEFDFFPQLPQMLAGMGFEYASLFFQWTWHTPEVPRESIPAVWWEAPDGSRLLAATRNALNLHQWPEDFAGLLDSDAPREMPAAGIQQWLELMPSPDWMCRSELMIPPMQELMADQRFEVRPVTLSEYLEVAKPHAEVRRYSLDDVFHGLSLGKNGDFFRHLSARAERNAVAAEAIATLAGFLGRPYPQWDVYPVWELEEAWRDLMIGQHHDNDECEGLMGHIGATFYQKSLAATEHVTSRTLTRMAEAFGEDREGFILFNPVGWERDASFRDETGDGPPLVARKLPPFGYRVVGADQLPRTDQYRMRLQPGEGLTFTCDKLSVTVNEATGAVTQITSPEFPNGALPAQISLGEFRCWVGGQEAAFRLTECDIDDSGQGPPARMTFEGPGRSTSTMTVQFAPDCEAIDIEMTFTGLPPFDPGFAGALRWNLAANLDDYRLVHSHPYGVSEIEATGSYVRKYPTGDWMTSPQVFETVEHPFTSQHFVDFDGGERGLLYVTGGNQSFLRRETHVEQILSLYDPWDEDYFIPSLDLKVRVMPHGRLTHTKRWKVAQTFLQPIAHMPASVRKGPLPFRFSPVVCDSPNVVMTALYRESAKAGEYLDDYAGAEIDYPVIVRLVELDGQPGTATLTVAGEVAIARRATMRGDRITDLEVQRSDQPPGMNWPEAWSRITLDLRPYEIATVYLDPVMARKQTRDLDAHRDVWATVHREH